MTTKIKDLPLRIIKFIRLKNYTNSMGGIPLRDIPVGDIPVRDSPQANEGHQSKTNAGNK